MDLRKIHKYFVSYRFPLILTILVFIVLRLPGNGDWLSISLWGSTLLQLVIALFLLYLTQIFGIIRQKTLLPAFFYVLLAGANPLFAYDLTGSVSALTIALCFLFLFNSYQNPLSQGNALNISLLLTLCSFYWFPILLFFPLFWYGMYQFRCLNIKTFLASLTGFLLIYLFLFTWSVYKGDPEFFLKMLPDFKTIGTIQIFSFGLKAWIMNGLILLLFILSGIKIYMAGVSEKVQAVTTLSYLFVFTLVVYVLYLIQNQWKQEWLLILYMPISLLISHYFTLSNKLWTIRLFLLTVILFGMMFD
ncbi:hypothetical protein FACS189421_01930 [Bacteroidia bacterium]|nr:hypothetical protein FACS189421_01930 [Bacteroidia bacterium]GHT48207.1 hypothetical protein FACS189440_11190 [Bacteroidia bacterium]